jgi:hypothetical protein
MLSPKNEPALIVPHFGNPIQAASSEGLLKKTHLLKTTTVWHETAGMNDRMTMLNIEIQRLGSICRLEATPIRMVTKEARTEAYRILAQVRVFHQAIREIERLPQIPSPTYFRIWKTPLTVRSVGHAPRNSIQPAKSSLSALHPAASSPRQDRPQNLLQFPQSVLRCSGESRSSLAGQGC